MGTSQALNEYLRLAKIQEFEKKYSQNGFDVEINAQSGKYTFDLIAQDNLKKNTHKMALMLKLMLSQVNTHLI